MAQRTPYSILTRSFRGRVLENEPMARHTTYRIGGPADLFVAPESLEDLRTVLRFLKDYEVFGLILGKGSNLLVSDDGIRGVVIRLDRCCNEINIDNGQVRAGAAVPLERLLDRAGEAGFGGIEFFSGIPGTVGGAVRLKAGAFGGEIGDRIVTVDVLDPMGERDCRGEKEMTFHYRGVKGLEGCVVLSCCLSLDRVASREVAEERKRLRLLRKEKQPLNLPSCGSVFKRSPGALPPGALIEKAGCKGLRQGGAEVSRLHANFIVNTGAATARDVRCLIRDVRRRVIDQFGIELTPEVELVGEHVALKNPPL